MVSIIKSYLNWEDPKNAFISCPSKRTTKDASVSSYNWESIVEDWETKSYSFDYPNNPSPPPPPSNYGPIAMANGTIRLSLREGVWWVIAWIIYRRYIYLFFIYFLPPSVDMTLDGAVRVLNRRSLLAVSLSRCGNSSALIHPNGRVLQSGSKVEIVTYDGMKNNDFM